MLIYDQSFPSDVMHAEVRNIQAAGEQNTRYAM